MTIPEYPPFALHWYKGILHSSFNPNTTCCVMEQRKEVEHILEEAIVNSRIRKQKEISLEKDFDFTALPTFLCNAPEYMKELVQRTGRLLNSYFPEECAQRMTSKRISVEQTPELKYFIKVNKNEKQQIYGSGYQMFDRIF